MAHWRTMIEKDYLGAWDLVGTDGKPRDFTVQIKAVESRQLKTRETIRTNPNGKRKVVVRFEKAEKAMVANSTNCESIEGMYGSDVDRWVGKLITIYPTTCDVGPKKNVPCIRVRPTPPKGKAEGVVSRPVDEEQRATQNEAFGREPGEEG
jgi:hypothetical protein